MLKACKQILIPLSLMALMFNNSVWATNTDFDFSVTPVADNVYSIIAPAYGLPSPENKGWNSNSHFVVTEEGVLVFDTGSSELVAQGIRRAIKSVTNKPVRWVVNSHSHADHWFGNAEFADTGAEIIATAAALTIMKQDGPGAVEFFSRVTEGATGTTRLIHPTTLLTQREKRNIGGVEVEFIFSNDGHSPGDVLMWLPKQKIIFGGDVLNSDWMPMIIYHGNVDNLINTINVVAKLNPTIVLPGHGKPTTGKSVIRDADLLAAVWSMVKAGYKAGNPQDEIQKQISTKLGPIYRPLYKNFDSAIKQQVEAMYKKQQ
ncbi:MBL fold metallo-hydrolase [Colwellia piezophila]|uniref:MBL fold metallo-hydrolase n=1 Tax=Colwellia piezophila TaxID=211668 RepID=UPI000369731B|nr:MBL fold metallo-hydrolase [Colwellia piezophila]